MYKLEYYNKLGAFSLSFTKLGDDVPRVWALVRRHIEMRGLQCEGND